MLKYNNLRRNIKKRLACDQCEIQKSSSRSPMPKVKDREKGVRCGSWVRLLGNDPAVEALA